MVCFISFILDIENDAIKHIKQKMPSIQLSKDFCVRQEITKDIFICFIVYNHEDMNLLINHIRLKHGTEEGTKVAEALFLVGIYFENTNPCDLRKMPAQET